jgi:hypothetical protein
LQAFRVIQKKLWIGSWLEIIINNFDPQEVKISYTPESQVAYTPESQVKLYAGVTGNKGKPYAGVTGKSIRRSHRSSPRHFVSAESFRKLIKICTPESQVKLYAGVTGNKGKLYAGVTGKSIRRSHR